MIEQAHGEYTLEVEGNVIHLITSGNFNEFGVLSFERKIKESILNLADTPFVMLVDMADMHGATPEAYQAIDELNVWLNNSKMRAKAIVMSSAMMQGIVKSRVTALQEQNHKVFTDKKDAQDWLAGFI